MNSPSQRALITWFKTCSFIVKTLKSSSGNKSSLYTSLTVSRIVSTSLSQSRSLNARNAVVCIALSRAAFKNSISLAYSIATGIASGSNLESFKTSNAAASCSSVHVPTSIFPSSALTASR